MQEEIGQKFYSSYFEQCSPPMTYLFELTDRYEIKQK